MKTRVRCVMCFIVATFAFLWALGTVCYEWGYFEDFEKVDVWHKIICVYQGLLVLLTIWCFFNHPYYTPKVLLAGAIYSAVLPAIFLAMVLFGVIYYYPNVELEIDAVSLISITSSAIVSALLFWSAHKEKRVIPQESKDMK